MPCRAVPLAGFGTDALADGCIQDGWIVTLLLELVYFLFDFVIMPCSLFILFLRWELDK